MGCEGKENTMDEKKSPTGYSRRGFLKSGSAVLAGGIMGCASFNVSSPKKKTADAPPPLPWPWGKIDPMEAGSRAYHIYLKAGG
jgi:anaerobic selenocysteine-containing dehydrogenase